LLLLIAPTITIFMVPTTALAQSLNTTIARTDTFAMDGQIGSLVLGMPPNTKVIDMTTVPKFILSGDWNMNVDQGNLADFRADLYTGSANGAENHTHQLGILGSLKTLLFNLVQTRAYLSQVSWTLERIAIRLGIM
jgi:hypothetical protein